jgi:hypothetical protein
MTTEKKSSKNSLPENGITSDFDIQKLKADFLRAKEQGKKASKEFREKYKGYEPYDLQEIENIIQQVIKQTTKGSIEDKISAYSIALDKTNLIIKNSQSVYDDLEKEGSISEPEVYCEAKQKAKNLKQNLEIKITELKLEITKQAESNVEHNDKKPEDKASSDLNSPVMNDSNRIFEDKNVFTVEEAAEHWQVSESSISHWISEEIIECDYIGRLPRFTKTQLLEISKAFNRKNNERKLKKQKPGIVSRSEKPKHHFIFKIPLEKFTNVFVQEGYLDDENAILMNDRFSKEPKLRSVHIEWKKDLQSLMTFIYLADRLDFIDKSMTTDAREHNSSSGEDKEKMNNEEERREVKYQVLINENFNKKKEGWSNPQLSNAWKHVNKAIGDLRKQIAERKNIKIEDVEKYITRKEAIEYYFNNKSLYFRIETTKDHIIDKKMLDIISDLKSAK